MKEYLKGVNAYTLERMESREKVFQRLLSVLSLFSLSLVFSCALSVHFLPVTGDGRTYRVAKKGKQLMDRHFGEGARHSFITTTVTVLTY